MSRGTCTTLLQYWLRQSQATRGSSNFAGKGISSKDRMLQCWLWGEQIGPRVPQNFWHRLKIFLLWEWKILNILQEQPTKIAVPWTCKTHISQGFLRSPQAEIKCIICQSGVSTKSTSRGFEPSQCALNKVRKKCKSISVRGCTREFPARKKPAGFHISKKKRLHKEGTKSNFCLSPNHRFC